MRISDWSSDVCSSDLHNPIETEDWRKLEMVFLTLQATHMRELFHDDPERFQHFTLQFEDILVDYSKNIVNEEVMKLLTQLANEVELRSAIDAMFKGEKIIRQEESTEKRRVGKECVSTGRSRRS